MEQIDGGKDCTLTRGDLTDMPSTLGNLSRDRQLNSQKSADVIVPYLLEKVREGLNN